MVLDTPTIAPSLSGVNCHYERDTDFSRGKAMFIKEHEIATACIHAPGINTSGGNKNGEFVQVRIASGKTLAGYTVLQTVNPGKPNEHLSPLHVFSAADNIPPVALGVVLRSGSGVASLDSDKNWHLFVAPAGHSGHWLLNNEGEHIVLTNQAGTKVSEKTFSAHFCGLVQKFAAAAVATGIIASGSAAAAYGEVS